MSILKIFWVKGENQESVVSYLKLFLDAEDQSNGYIFGAVNTGKNECEYTEDEEEKSYLITLYDSILSIYSIETKRVVESLENGEIKVDRIFSGASTRDTIRDIKTELLIDKLND